MKVTATEQEAGTRRCPIHREAMGGGRIGHASRNLRAPFKRTIASRTLGDAIRGRQQREMGMSRTAKRLNSVCGGLHQV